MPKVVFGSSDGVPFVKIMVNPDDDPFTTSDNQYGKFYFNSNTDKISYVYDIRKVEANAWAFGGGGSTRKYYVDGDSVQNCEAHIVATRNALGASYQLYYYLFLNHVMGDMGKYSPFVEVKGFLKNSSARTGPKSQFTWVNSVGIRSAGYWDGTMAVGGALNPRETDVFDYFTSSNPPAPGNGIGLAWGWENSGGGDNYAAAITIWDMPGNAEAMQIPVGTPTTGQKPILIQSNPPVFKIARKGFDVGTATGKQLIIDDDWVPAKVLKTGNITIASNANHTIYSPLPMDPQSTVVDFMVCRSGGKWVHPVVPRFTDVDSDQISLDYNMYSDRVVMKNTSPYAIDVRYLILGDDDNSETSGNPSKMIRVENDGLNDYVQFKRPGSSDVSPNLNEIYLDTRLAYLPIVSEGYIPIGNMTDTPIESHYGNRAKHIDFINDGSFFPFVKFAIVFDAGGGFTRYFLPTTRVLFTIPGSSYRMMPANQSSCAVINSAGNRVTFHTTRGNPGRVRATSSGFEPAPWPSRDENPIGIRYYIFAIPNSL